MYLPYGQIANEVVDFVAPELAVATGWTEAESGWGLILFFRWALRRCPDNEPPSLHGVIPDPNAARLVALAMRCPFEPERLVNAMLLTAHAVLERVPVGLRVRGLDRYNQAWLKNRPDAKKWRAFLDGKGPKPDPKSPKKDLNKAGNRPESDLNKAGNRPESDLNKAGKRPPDADADADAFKETALSTHADRVVTGKSDRPDFETPESDPVFEVYDYWRGAMGKGRTKLDAKRRRAIKAQFDQGRSVVDLKQAVDGCKLTPHNMGENDRGQKYDDIELICRDAAHVERFMANAATPTKQQTKLAVAPERVRSKSWGATPSLGNCALCGARDVGGGIIGAPPVWLCYVNRCFGRAADAITAGLNFRDIAGWIQRTREADATEAKSPNPSPGESPKATA